MDPATKTSQREDIEFGPDWIIQRGKALAAELGDTGLIESFAEECPRPSAMLAGERKPIARQRAFLRRFFDIFPNAEVVADYTLHFGNISWSNPLLQYDLQTCVDRYLKGSGRAHKPVRVLALSEVYEPFPPLATVIEGSEGYVDERVQLAFQERRNFLQTTRFIFTMALHDALTELQQLTADTSVGEALVARVRQIAVAGSQRSVLADVYPGATAFLEVVKLATSGYIALGEGTEAFDLVRVVRPSSTAAS